VSRLPLWVEDPPQRLFTEDWLSCTTTCHEVIATLLVFAMVTLAQYPEPQSEDRLMVALALPPVTSLCSTPDLSGSETSCTQATNTRETRKADRAISDRGRRSVRMPAPPEHGACRPQETTTSPALGETECPSG
jgi:hypothetical protein